MEKNIEIKVELKLNYDDLDRITAMLEDLYNLRSDDLYDKEQEAFEELTSMLYKGMREIESGFMGISKNNK